MSDPLLFDQFTGTQQQTTRRKALCWISVDGVDVTNRLDPHLISVHLLDAGITQCDIELDDRDGRLPIPAAGSPVNVELGWDQQDMVTVFTGYTLDIESGFGRKEGGRRLWVHAYGIDAVNTKIKTPMQDHAGEGAPPGMQEGTLVPFLQMAQQVVGNAGVGVLVHPDFASIGRDYWSQNNESAMQWMERHATEMGAVLRGAGGNFVFTKPGENVDGSPGPLINATWGDNLIGWRVHPFVARTAWGSANQQYFDTGAGQWTNLSKNFGLAPPFGGAAPFQLPTPAPNAGVAGQQNAGNAETASAHQGQGRIQINGEPRAKYTGNVLLTGARPGVDGLYYIFTAEHMYSRQGYVTWLDVFPNATAAANNVGSTGWPGPFTTQGPVPAAPVLPTGPTTTNQ